MNRRKLFPHNTSTRNLLPLNHHLYVHPLSCYNDVSTVCGRIVHGEVKIVTMTKVSRRRGGKGETPSLTPRQLILLLFLCGSLGGLNTARIVRGIFIFWKREGKNLPAEIGDDLDRSYTPSFLTTIFSDLSYLEKCQLIVSNSPPNTLSVVKSYSPTIDGLFWAKKFAHTIPRKIRRKIKRLREWVETVPFPVLERSVHEEFTDLYSLPQSI